ncbi:Cyclopentanone 1,2-monooxygenase [Termitomyces sp. J132]|nr:Cyclopentanone 1,2-monooxygenase [Termitomyces sp. J132]
MSGHQNLDVLIVGAGFSGVYQLHKLRKAGFSVKLFEAGSNLGGIWHWNCYPGARVDTDFSMYQLSLEELWRDWNWVEKYPGRQEIIKYFDYVDRKLGVSRDISFNTRVTSASFNTTTNRWSVFTDTGITVNPHFLILCTGFASKPLFPNIPGLDNFQGTVHHTSLWPQAGVDMAGKRVGIIGTGASGVQVIQEVGPIAAHLTVFQRTPNLALPMNQSLVDVATQTKMKEEMYPILFRRQERYLLFNDLWSKGGFHYIVGSCNDITSNEKVNAEMYAFWRKKVLERIRDPEMQRKLAPEKPPHPFGVKRHSLEQSYYEVFNQSNVALIDLNENPIIEVVPNGVKTRDGVVHEFDVLVLATGFDAVTGSISQIDIKGTDGVSIGDKWKKGLSTYLGMSVAGYPNMFFPYGPHGPTAFCNGPTCVELQGDWIIDCITYLRQHNYARIDPTQEASEDWVQRVTDLFSQGLYLHAKSWYTGANVPGKRIEALNFVGGLPLYTTLIQESARGGYAGFTLTPDTSIQAKL